MKIRIISADKRFKETLKEVLLQILIILPIIIFLPSAHSSTNNSIDDFFVKIGIFAIEYAIVGGVFKYDFEKQEMVLYKGIRMFNWVFVILLGSFLYLVLNYFLGV